MATVTGGAKLRATLEQYKRMATGPDRVKVGFLEGSYPEGPPIATVAAWNEFGRGPGTAVRGKRETHQDFARRSHHFVDVEFGLPAHGQPPRPFFRNMIAEQSPTWGRKAASIMRGNGNDIAATLEVMGQEIAGRLKESINALTDPPLAPSTIARKGFDKPLIHTSLMVNSVSHVVEGGDAGGT